MNEDTLLQQAINEAKRVVNEAMQFGSPAHAYQEMDELLAWYINQYPTRIPSPDLFIQQVHEAVFGGK